MIDNPNFQQALKEALDLLRVQSRSRKEIIEKLTKRGFENVVIEQTIAYLESKSLMSDEKMANEFIEMRARKKPMGRQMLRQEMEQKGLTDNVIESILRDWDEQRESDLALHALKQKWGETPKSRDLKAVRQWMGFLIRRGFEEEVALQALRAYGGDEIDDYL